MSSEGSFAVAVRADRACLSSCMSVSDVRRRGPACTRPARSGGRSATSSRSPVRSRVVLVSWRPSATPCGPLTVGFGFCGRRGAAASSAALGPGIRRRSSWFLAFNFFFLPPYGTVRDRTAPSTCVALRRVPRAVGADLVALRACGGAGGRGRGARRASCRRCRSSAATSSCRGPGEETYGALLGDVVRGSASTPAPSSCRSRGRARRAGDRRRPIPGR